MNRPLKKFRAGQVSCALWENEIVVNGREMTMLKATFERRYKDKEGNWQSSQSFSRNEIPLVKWCLDKAFEAMIEEQSGDSISVEEEVIESGGQGRLCVEPGSPAACSVSPTAPGYWDHTG